MIEQTNNTTTKQIRFAVTVAGYRRVGRSRFGIRLPITQVSWDTGRGVPAYQLAKVWNGRDTEAKPMLFSKCAAEAVADQLTKRFRLVDPQITPVEVK